MIEVDRLNPDPYLKRSFANLELGQREAAMADYQIYTSQTETTHPFSIQDFSAGFTNGLPKGMYASGESLALFTSDTVTQPIQTGRQIWDALVLLSDLARSEEWSTLGETMAPEIHKLITEWDHLSSRERGELAGFAFGKHGADIVIPGATVKGISRGTQIAKTLKKARRGCEAAERILVLESTAGEIAEIPPKALKNLDHLPPELQKSYHLYEKAQNYLKPYKGYMTEEAAKELIHQAGIPTFPRPPGIPENFRIQLSKRGAGIKYVDPENPGNNIRVMPGKPHSPWEHQQKPYVVEYINGQPIDAAGNMVLDSAPEAHVPLEKYTYKVEIKRSKPGN